MMVGRKVDELSGAVDATIPFGPGVSRTTRGSFFSRAKRHTHYFDHPFKVDVTSATILTVGQGYVWVGDAYYDFPQAGDTDTVDCSTLGTGSYLVVMEVEVEPTGGLFTGGYKPALDVVSLAGAPILGSGPVVQFCIGKVTTASNIATAWQQRRFEDIDGIVETDFDTGGVATYRARRRVINPTTHPWPPP